MNKIALNVSVKYGVLLGIISIGSALLILNGSTPGEGLTMITIVTIAVMWIARIGLLARSHYEYNEKNNDYISFKDAILIGLVVLGISAVISGVIGYINYEFVIKEKMDTAMNQMGASGISYSAVMFSGMISNLVIDVIVLFGIITLESMWKIFKKAGKEGWASLIPFYNTITLLDIVGKPAIWFLLMFIPIVNVILGIWVVNLLAKRFGKSDGYTVGMLFLPFIFYPMLGLSEQQMIPVVEEQAY